MSDPAKLPLLAHSFFCCLLSVPSFLLPGNLAWANFYYFLYLSVYYFLYLIFSLPRDSWWKVRWCFAYALNMWADTFGPGFCIEIKDFCPMCGHTVWICTSLTQCLLVWQALDVPHTRQPLGPLQSVWHLQEELTLITGLCVEAVGLGNPKAMYVGAT